MSLMSLILRGCILSTTIFVGSSFSACKTTDTVSSASAAALQGNKIPLRDFFRNPEQAGFKISPDGRFVAYLMPWEKRMNIFVQPLSAEHMPVGTPKQLTFVKDRSIAAFFWKKSQIMYAKDDKGDENFSLYRVNPDTGKEINLTPYPGVKAGMLDDLMGISDTDVLIQMNKRNKQVFDVYRLNVKTGKMKLVAENNGKILGWETDHKGRIRLAYESDGATTKVFTRKSEKKKFKQILEYSPKDHFAAAFFTFDNKDLYCISNLGRDKTAIVRIDPETGKELEQLFAHPDFDVDHLHFSKKRKVITAASFTSWKSELHFFDAEAKARNEFLKSQIGADEEIYLTSTNEDETLYTAVVTSDKTRGRYYVYDKVKNKLTFLVDTSPWLDTKKLAAMKPIQYKSRDGLLIHGYLTLPNIEQKTNLPVIIHPHGGPWVRDDWGFNSEVQFLANRGYAVLQMNFRSSTGYGKAFLSAGFKQWGKAMQDDITDGVQWLIAQGIADPARVGIYGASYGGYATLAGLTFTPELYACGVDYVGVSNLFTFMKSIPEYWKPLLDSLHERVGHPVKDEALLREASPVFHVDRIRAPLFVAQGAKDPRVNIEESNQIVEALRKRGVDVEYMVKDNEGHGFSNEENRFEFYEKMEAFLAKHL